MRSLHEVAQRLIWWSKPEDALQDPKRLIAQIMTYGDLEDTQAMLRAFSRAQLEDVLNNPPSGVFTPEAWNAWHLLLGKKPKPLPRRTIPSQDASSSR